MSSARTVLGALLLSLGSLSACTLLTSLDDLASGSPTEADLGAHVADGSVDGGRDDAAMITDGSVEADAGALSWCALHRGDAAFCEDFDDGDLSHFDSVVEQNGTVKRDEGTASSPRFSLASSANDLVDAGQVSSCVGYTGLDTAATVAEFSVDVRLDTATDGKLTDQQFIKITVTKDTKRWQIGLGASPSGFFYAFSYDMNTNTYTQLNTPPTTAPIGKWFTMTVKFAIQSAGNATLDAQINGALWASAIKSAPPMAAGQMMASFGINYSPGGTRPGFSNHVDNLVVDIH